jgi:hypothetical protein
VVHRQASFKTDQPGDLKKSQIMEFWNSQPQCFGGRLPPDVDVERNRF